MTPCNFSYRIYHHAYQVLGSFFVVFQDSVSHIDIGAVLCGDMQQFLSFAGIFIGMKLLLQAVVNAFEFFLRQRVLRIAALI